MIDDLLINTLLFPRTHRLLTQTDYQTVFDKSTKVSHRFFSLLFKPNQKTHSRLGLLVGKRISKSAVVRNRIKRTIRESFRCHQNQLKGFDIIVMPRIQCNTLTKDKLREDINCLWQKLNNFRVAQPVSSSD